jgi:hypothetical protein
VLSFWCRNREEKKARCDILKNSRKDYRLTADYGKDGTLSWNGLKD